MKFDVVIGNPPYQEKAKGDSTKDTPVYHHFYNLAGAISDRYCLISPGRFLFNAGSTDKRWNEQMLNDKHLKVKYYEADSNKVFSGTNIMGGVAVLYRDTNSDFGEIGTFSAHPVLFSILQKVSSVRDKSLHEIITNRGQYRYSDLIYQEYPELMKSVSDRRIASNAFSKLKEMFTAEPPDNANEFIKIFGRDENTRCYKWFRTIYMNSPENLNYYKIVVPKANGSAPIGDYSNTPVIGKPEMLEPGVGYTETFIGIGCFKDIVEAQNALKYIKSKFARVLLGILKTTQDNTSEKWRLVPLQDFTSKSDIDWSGDVRGIDLQLYRKYKLNSKEVDFIENAVRTL